MNMKKNYDLGRYEAVLEKTSSGYYKLRLIDLKYSDDIEKMFSNKLQALEEIVSYIEIDTEKRGW